MKRILMEELLPGRQLPYDQQYAHIMALFNAGKIKPLKASGKNGKKPALYREYWLIEEKEDTKELEEELKFGLDPGISIDYYQSHLEIYRQERKWVLMLSSYMKNCQEKLQYPESVNERSFEIWNREKFLSKEQGKKILRHCGLAPEDFCLYETAEPLPCYSHTRNIPQNLLILENKDTFYSMRRHLLGGHQEILGVSIGTLIYGAGKGILRSFHDFELCAEPYMTDERNQIYYFGDLDYEGIGIYESLALAFKEYRAIRPFCPGYEKMLQKAASVTLLPDTKEQQNRNIRGSFFDWFDKGQVQEMEKILRSGKYIPQEIVNLADF